MEIRLNLALLAVLGVIWCALSPSEPVSALDPSASETRELAMLEDEFAHDRSDTMIARHLASRYLELDRPGLAIAALRSADPSVLEDPAVAHRLAQAYESTGRMLDALATADVAATRCARYLGATDTTAVTALPRHACDEREYALLEMHRTALSHMVRWGVSNADSDARRQVAYDIAMRRATVASVQ